MKKLNPYANFIAICSLALSTTAMAGQVGSMNSFSAGSAAVAADVNANFNEHTSQINDNDARITAMRTGAVSVAGHAFRNEDDAEVCNWTAINSFAYGYFADTSSATGSCDAVAGISLPDGVSLTGFNCSFFDNDATNLMIGRMFRVNLATGAIETIYQTASTSNSAAIQVVSDSIVNAPGAEVVNNAVYTYYIAAQYSALDFTALGSNGRVYGCSATY